MSGRGVLRRSRDRGLSRRARCFTGSGRILDSQAVCRGLKIGRLACPASCDVAICVALLPGVPDVGLVVPNICRSRTVNK